MFGNQRGQTVDEADNQLGAVVARRCLRAEDEHTRLHGEARVIDDAVVQHKDVQSVEHLALVFVQPLGLCVEDEVRVNDCALMFFQEIRQANLVVVLNLLKLLAERRVVSVGRKVMQQFRIFHPVRADGVADKLGQFRVARHQPAAMRDAVGNCAELLRHNEVEVVERLLLEDIAVQLAHAVGGERHGNAQVRHVDVTVGNNRHATHALRFAGEEVPQARAETLVHFHQNLIDARQQALHHVFRPLFERFRHDGVVGVRHCAADNLLRFVPAQAFFVHQQAHQFRNRQTRMRVVDVDDDLLRQLAPVRAVELLEVLEDVLEGGGGEEILLLQAEQLAFVVVVFGVEDVGDGFRQFLFLRRLHIVAVVEVAQVNALRGAGAPQAQTVDGGGVIAHQRHVVGNSLDRVVADVTEHRAAVLVAHFDVTVEVHFAGILHYGHFPHVAVAQPVVRQLDLLTVHNLLAEQTVFIADGAAHRGQVKGRQRVHEARCQTAQTAVAQRGFRLFLKHLVHVDVQFVQRLLVGIKRDEVQDVGV